MLLQLAQQMAELMREPRQPCRRAEEFQPVLMLGEQGAQDHQPPFLAEQLRGRRRELFENEAGQPLEGQDLQASVTAQLGIRQELALELKGGLLGREKKERRSGRRSQQRAAAFRHTTESLATPRGPEQKPDEHAPL